MAQKPKRAHSPSNTSAYLLQTTVPKDLFDYVTARTKEERRPVSAWIRYLIESHQASFQGDKTDSERIMELEEKVARIEAALKNAGHDLRDRLLR